MRLPMGIYIGALENLQITTAMCNITAGCSLNQIMLLHSLVLIDFLHPQLALLSVAAADRSGLPSPETLDALQGYNLLRTDHNGWIQITTDGMQMWVEVERR